MDAQKYLSYTNTLLYSETCSSTWIALNNILAPVIVAVAAPTKRERDGEQQVEVD